MNELCTISVGRDRLEDKYTFFKNGRIQHSYDESILNYGLMEWVKPGEIDNIIKRRILKNCPKPHKKEVRQILAFNLRLN
ncbi:hypothetical protein [Aquimarina spongiae]|uniref:Uncharacterized protein n=1 Tax=Aquimarina spongiae TaxID=570521 RepID=A0A1M6B1R8_9FLAO|nr:hypothetical protein [Aquimarina spongiae]SHI42630.1 hypothetical protein SAMN04488508_101583 [Aquimarina spongiae]